ncbi:unnamed protein product, partial [Rotaria socialis]
IFDRPIHFEAHSKVNTFQSQKSLSKHLQNALTNNFMAHSKSHPIHIEAKSRIHSWNGQQTSKRDRSLSITRNQQATFTDPKPAIHTWNSKKSIKPKVAGTDIPQPINIIGKPTVDNWNDLSRKPFQRNEQMHTSTWPNDTKQLETSMIDFNHVKPTIDTWNEHIDSSRSRSLSIEQQNLAFIDPKSSVNTWRDNIKPSKRKLLKMPEPSLVREETIFISTPKNEINNRQNLPKQRQMHFEPVSHIDCWNLSYQPRFLNQKQLHPLRIASFQNDFYPLSNYQILPPIQSSESQCLVTSAKPQGSAPTSKASTTHKAPAGPPKPSTQKLPLNAKSKTGSLDSAHPKPVGSAAKVGNKKPDPKEKSKPNADSNASEIMTTGGGSNEASATVNNEKVGETSNEIMESQKPDDGDQ